eukprot:TRINITY_DN25027_c0_g1_i1.p1 TRINITY_DN25027_c0_g1~~TRINITY_DN25027_c0_g1_i1.p1  ORF type:complete len:756 (+),score=76.31 TRINITY_DN25027_c0_g1_i1:43-2310(+)
MAPSGMSGVTGPSGTPGIRGRDGRTGASGTVQYILNNSHTGGSSYPEIFRLDFSQYGRSIVEAVDGFIFEPGNTYLFTGTTVRNSSRMPLAVQDVPFQVSLESNDHLTFDPSSTIAIEHPIPAHGDLRLSGGLSFTVKKLRPGDIRCNHIFIGFVPLCYTISMPAIGYRTNYVDKDRPICVRYPVVMSPVTMGRTVIPETEVSLKVMVDNLFTKVPLGSDSANGRTVALRFSVSTEGVVKMKLGSGGVHNFAEGSYIENIPLINGLGSHSFFASLIFCKDVPTYTPVHIKVELLLSEVTNHREMINVQTHSFSTTVCEPYVHDPRVDFLLCVNHGTPLATIKKWKNHLGMWSLNVNTWDISLYDGWKSTTVPEGANMPFTDFLLGKSIILLNTMYVHRGTGVQTLPSSLLDKQDLYEFLVDCSLFIVGGIGSFSLPVMMTSATVTEYGGIKEFLDAKDLQPARIAVYDKITGSNGPNPKKLTNTASNLLETLGQQYPSRRFLVRTIRHPELISKGRIRDVYRRGYIEVTQDQARRLKHHATNDFSVHITDSFQFFTAIQSIPFARKVAMLRDSVGAEAGMLKMAILSELVSQLEKFFVKDGRAKGDPLPDLRDLAVLLDSGMALGRLEAMMLHYEHAVNRMTKKTAFFYKTRFDKLSAAAKGIMAAKRRELGIDEPGYKEALDMIMEAHEGIPIGQLLNTIIYPYRPPTAFERDDHVSQLISGMDPVHVADGAICDVEEEDGWTVVTLRATESFV